MKKIALFGGTFDPIHEGHLEIATRAQKTVQLNHVIFIPCQQSPHKETETGATGEQRIEMLQRATADLSWASYSRYELDKSEPSYSYLTADHFQQNLSPEELYWIIGDDQWESLPRWKNIESLRSQVTFIVVQRHHELLPREDYSAIFIKGNPHPASATHIRNQVKKNEPPQWLDSDVYEYIVKQQLYR